MYNLEDRDKYIYYPEQLSYLRYCDRILHQCVRETIPLLERFKFLSRTSNKIDLFMSRLNSLKEKLKSDSKDKNLKIVLKSIQELLNKLDIVYEQLNRELPETLRFAQYNNLNKSQKERVKDIVYDTFDNIDYSLYKNKEDYKKMKLINSLSYLVLVTFKDNDKILLLDLSKQDRYIPIYPNKDRRNRYVLLDDVMRKNMYYYLGKNCKTVNCLKLIKDTRTNKISALLVDKYLRDEELIEKLTKIFEIDKSGIFNMGRIPDYNFLNNIEEYIDMEDELYREFEPIDIISQKDRPISKLIKRSSMILHHPYFSYKNIYDFLKEAINDKGVKFMYMTLNKVYDTNSPIVKLLIKGANKKKEIRLICHNINPAIIDKLKKANIKIKENELFSEINFTIIGRKNSLGDLQLTSHIGTINYDEKLADKMTSMSYFTSDQELIEDMLEVFNNGCVGNEIKFEINPARKFLIKNKVLDYIKDESDKNNRGLIIIKTSTLTDKDIIDALYEANSKGVDVKILCTGATSATSFKINNRKRKDFVVKSLIGRFDEDTTILSFGQGKKARTFISTLNLDSVNIDKVGILLPVKGAEEKEEMRGLLKEAIRDQYNAYIETGYGIYKKVVGEYNSQDNIMNNAILNFIDEKRISCYGNNNYEQDSYGSPHNIDYINRHKDYSTMSLRDVGRLDYYDYEYDDSPRYVTDEELNYLDLTFDEESGKLIDQYTGNLYEETEFGLMTAPNEPLQIKVLNKRYRNEDLTAGEELILRSMELQDERNRRHRY